MSGIRLISCSKAFLCALPQAGPLLAIFLLEAVPAGLPGLADGLFCSLPAFLLKKQVPFLVALVLREGSPGLGWSFPVEQ